MEITFEQLPMAVSQLFNKVDVIEQLLRKKTIETPRPENVWFDVESLIKYLPNKPARTTVYGWIQHGTIPHYKNGKKLSFLKSEIDVWLLSGKRKTSFQLEAEADESFILLNKKRM